MTKIKTNNIVKCDQSIKEVIPIKTICDKMVIMIM